MLSYVIVLTLLLSAGARNVQRESDLFPDPVDEEKYEESDNFQEASEDGLLHYNFQELIDHVNADPGATWEAGYNSYFKGRDKEAVRVLLGVLPTELPEKDKPLSGHAVQATPDTFDARSKWPDCGSIGDIRDQSACGSCWAFGAAEAISDRICIASKGRLKPRISADDLLTCCHECGLGCNGGEPLAAWQWWVSAGIVTGGNHSVPTGCLPYPFPACEHHIKPEHYKTKTPFPRRKDGYRECPTKEYQTPQCSKSCQSSYKTAYEADKHMGMRAYTVPATEAQIRSEIFQYGPVEAAFDVYEDFPHYKSGVYKHVSGGYLGGHAVKILGWGTEKGTPYWLVANSWNADWGMQGYFKILRGADECGIESGIVAGMPKV